MIARDDIAARLRSARDSGRTLLHGRWRSGAAGRNGARPGETETPDEIGPTELLLRRDQLARQLAELQWDLGGLTYEMAIRDHFRVDVLVRVAAQLQAIDGELAEIERLLHLAEAGAGGACPSCGALHARGAGFCWQCGTTLLPTHETTVA